jgi:hypothetical protein
MKSKQKQHDPMSDEIVITAEEMAAIDFDAFDPTGIELPKELEEPDLVIRRLTAGECDQQTKPTDDEKEASLFMPSSVWVGDVQQPIDRPRMDQLWSVVTRAYADVRCDKSIDYVVAEPDANLLFLRRCWELGAAASPFELNWVLMNARKDGKLRDLDLPRATRVYLPKKRLDLFSFAAEMAMRCVQDRLYYNNQDDVSIDRVLCDPHLVKEFDDLAAELAPGFRNFEYRWAVISLRKARRSKSVLSSEPTFAEQGSLRDVRVSRLPTTAGLYWVRSDDDSIFMGVADNLRTQVDALLQSTAATDAPCWVSDSLKKRSMLRLVECQATDALRTQSALLRRSGSLLNFHLGKFFGAVA